MSVVVNADDFGLSPATNQAILQSFDKGVISSTTAMANMPAFEEACALARERGIAAHVGLHFNLTTGPPLTDAMKRSPLFTDEDGQMRLTVREGLWLGPAQRRCLAGELAAQWNALRRNGIEPSHLDSHHHRHYAWSVMAVVVGLSHELGIPTVRPARLGTVRGRGALRGAYSAALNRRLRASGLLTARFMVGAPKTVAACDGVPPVDESEEAYEIMVHPHLDESGTVCNYAGGDALDAIVQQLAPTRRFCSYADLSRRGRV